VLTLIKPETVDEVYEPWPLPLFDGYARETGLDHRALSAGFSALEREKPWFWSGVTEAYRCWCAETERQAYQGAA